MQGMHGLMSNVSRVWFAVRTVVMVGAFALAAISSSAQMTPYFSTIDRPLGKGNIMLMALPDLQKARFGPNFATGMLMAEYGITPQWTAGLMVEGEKISGLPATYGGSRVNTWFHLFQDDRLLNLTLYGEFENLNAAALYKMEVAGFGPEDLLDPLPVARHTASRTFEQRVILYHDWERLSASFNFVRETPLQGSRTSDYGYTCGVFVNPRSMKTASSGMSGMSGMAKASASPTDRLGYGIEMLGALGGANRFGIYPDEEQHYIGPLITYDLSPRWSLRAATAIGLTKVSDPFVLRLGVAYMFGGRRSNMGSM